MPMQRHGLAARRLGGICSQPCRAGLPGDLRNQIKQARTKRGWGQRQLGAAVGLPQPHISAIESGEVVPRFDY